MLHDHIRSRFLSELEFGQAQYPCGRQSNILGSPFPLVAITFPTLSILTCSKPSSLTHLSFIIFASEASDFDGVYCSRAFFSSSIAYPGEINSYFPILEAKSTINPGISTPVTLTVFLNSVVLLIS